MNKSYVLHGENHPDSRRRLSELVLSFEEKGWEVNRVDWHILTRANYLGCAVPEDCFLWELHW